MGNKIHLILLLLSFILSCVFGDESHIKPTGQIKDLASGLCITTQALHGAVVLQKCDSTLSSQQFTIQMGIEYINSTDASHTFVSGSNCLYSNYFLDRVIWRPCDGGTNQINEWSFRFTKTGYRLISRRTITEKKCMSRDTDNTIKLTTCSSSSGIWVLPTAYQSPVLKQNGIPQTTGFILDSSEGNRRFYPGWRRVSGKFEIKFHSDCVIKVSKEGDEVWSNRYYPPQGCSSTAIMAFQKDGNLCVFLNETTTVPNWCSYTEGRNGKILNFLPRGSYGKEWMLAITTTSGKLVWAVSGKPIMIDSSYNMVPGSFLDGKDTTNNRLNAGKCLYGQRNLLCLTEAGKLKFFEQRSNVDGSYLERLYWDSFSYGTHELYNDTFLLVDTDGSVCIKRTSTNTKVWCVPNTAGLNVRYINVMNKDGPYGNEKENWALTLQDEILDVKWGLFSREYIAYQQFAYDEYLYQPRQSNLALMNHITTVKGLILTSKLTGITVTDFRTPPGGCGVYENYWTGIDFFGFYCLGSTTPYFSFSPKPGFPRSDYYFVHLLNGLPEIILQTVSGQMVDQFLL